MLLGSIGHLVFWRTIVAGSGKMDSPDACRYNSHELPDSFLAVSRERRSSRVWRRLNENQLEHPQLPITDNCRQTRIETLGSRYGDLMETTP